MRDSLDITIEDEDKVEFRISDTTRKATGYVLGFDAGFVTIRTNDIGDQYARPQDVTVLRRDHQPGYEGGERYASTVELPDEARINVRGQVVEGDTL